VYFVSGFAFGRHHGDHPKRLPKQEPIDKAHPQRKSSASQQEIQKTKDVTRSYSTGYDAVKNIKSVTIFNNFISELGHD
jgi:hypothetical protein